MENNILDLLNDVDDKYIIEAAQDNKKKKPVFYKGLAAAACFCFIITGSFLAINYFQPDSFPNNPSLSASTENSSIHTNKLIINELSSPPSEVDIKTKYETAAAKIPYDVWKAVVAAFESFSGKDLESFNAMVPPQFKHCGFFPASLRGYKDGHLEDLWKYYDYVFSYVTETGGEAYIALSSEDLSSRLFTITDNHPDLTEINGIQFTVFSYESSFYVSFYHNHVNYDIKTTDVSSEDLYELLQSIALSL